jgi:hypothetical protein
MQAPVKLTRDKVEALKPANARREVRDALAPGLRLVVQPSGHKSWAFRFKLGGVARKLTLGDYPAVSLDAARTAAATARGEVLPTKPSPAPLRIASWPPSRSMTKSICHGAGNISTMKLAT